MNCSKIMRRLLKNFIIKSLVLINLFSLLYWMCLVDYIISWQPVVIMAVNFLFLWLVAYANDWVYDTKQYYERLQKEGGSHGSGKEL